MEDEHLSFESKAASQPGKAKRFISVVTPAFNESMNLPHLYDRIKAVLDGLPFDWEWVIVDDHSADTTFEVIDRIAEDSRVRGIRLARNSGAHVALTCALHAARGECAIALASDLQDPPGDHSAPLEEWHSGNKVVWAARSQRLGESSPDRVDGEGLLLADAPRGGLNEIFPQGSGLLSGRSGCTRGLSQVPEEREHSGTGHLDGIPQTSVSYTKQPRAGGESGWTLKKK